MDAWIVVARALLAAVFIVAGIAKIRNIEKTRGAAEDLGIPSSLARPVAGVLPVIEIATAAMLLLEFTARWGAATAALLLIAFTSLIAVNLASGNRADCACFGGASVKPIGWGTLLRNAALLGAAGSIVAGGPLDMGIPGALASLSATPWMAASGILGMVVAAQSWLLVRARRPVMRPPVSPGTALVRGTQAPDFTLPSLDEQEITLDAIIGEGRPTMLLFAHPDCGPCRALAPDLARWDEELHDVLTIAVISTADAEATRTERPHVHPRRVLVDGADVAREYRSPGTPSAVLVDTSGAIASEMVAGPTRIRELVDGLTGASAPTETQTTTEPVVTRRKALRGAVAVAGAAAVGVVAGGRQAAAQSPLPGLDVLPCPSGFEKCDGVCRDTAINPDHCGACGRACAEGEMCRGGECVPCTCSEPCPSGTVDCDGACVDLVSDPANCGACGAACGPGEVCNNGACETEATCSDGILNGDETDVDCGGSCPPCTDGSRCAHGGDCQSGVCEQGFCAPACPPGHTDCGGTCVDLSSDVNNCGACGARCDDGDPNTVDVCTAGACFHN